MDDDSEEVMDFLDDDDEQDNGERMPRRYIRDMESPFDRYDEEAFLRRYRFSKGTVLQSLIPLISGEKVTKRGLPVPPVYRICILLRFLATCSFQLVCADLEHLSESTVCRIVKEAAKEIAQYLHRYVHFPRNGQGMRQIKAKFQRIAGFPGVIGCIDCTHVAIKNPNRINGERYRNRKGWMSLNIQVVSGPDYEIQDIVMRWPGSAHDSRIFDASRLKLRCDRGELEGILLGNVKGVFFQD
ncbi:hypothetical protein M8J76_006643 [Diaphorina citri]|nr:hypothetical protein M8J75_015171 [Diaphorina citri]KAI5722307.1 hypothetical protein M8J76_006643 [Diaphorina citri]